VLRYDVPTYTNLAAGLITANAKLFSGDLKIQQFSFDQFKQEYGRTYTSPEEEKTRFGHFITNLKIIDERNTAETGTAIHGMYYYYYYKLLNKLKNKLVVFSCF
jgi:hypothetical protein